MKIDRHSMGLGILTGIVIGIVLSLTVPIVLNSINSMFAYGISIKLNNDIPETISVGTEAITMEYQYRPSNFAPYNLYLQSGSQNVTYQVNFGDTFPVFDISVHIARISADNSTMTVEYKQVTH